MSELAMSVEIADGVKIKAVKIGEWFLYGFALTTLVVNMRGIAGFVQYVK